MSLAFGVLGVLMSNEHQTVLFDLSTGQFYPMTRTKMRLLLKKDYPEFLKLYLEYIKKEKLNRMRQVASSPRAIATVFLFFLIPGIPKDIICYAAGLSKMSFRAFITISTLGRMPGIIGSVLMGDTAARQQWVFSGIIAAISLVLFTIGLVFRKRLSNFLAHFANETAADEKNKAQLKRILISIF